jgi:hypothetical protein
MNLAGWFKIAMMNEMIQLANVAMIGPSKPIHHPDF